MSNSQLMYSQVHPIILDGRHSLTKLIVWDEHLRLEHAGPTLLQSSLNEKFHIIGARRVVRFVTRQCIICRRNTVQPQDQLLGQLPAERVSPSPPFEKTGVDYAGPFLIKLIWTREETHCCKGIYLSVCLSICEGRSFRTCFGSLHRSIHCCFTPVCCQTWFPLFDMERPWFQLYWC